MVHITLYTGFKNQGTVERGLIVNIESPTVECKIDATNYRITDHAIQIYVEHKLKHTIGLSIAHIENNIGNDYEYNLDKE